MSEAIFHFIQADHFAVTCNFAFKLFDSTRKQNHTEQAVNAVCKCHHSNYKKNGEGSLFNSKEDFFFFSLLINQNKLTN